MKGTPCDLLWPRMVEMVELVEMVKMVEMVEMHAPHGSAPGRIWPKITTLVRDHEHFMPTKFRKHPLWGSVVKADYVFPYIYMH